MGGLYERAHIIRCFLTKQSPSQLERARRLEQLRADYGPGPRGGRRSGIRVPQSGKQPGKQSGKQSGKSVFYGAFVWARRARRHRKRRFPAPRAAACLVHCLLTIAKGY